MYTADALLLFHLQERKKQVKEAQKEKRHNKVPKHVKKRKEKLAKTKQRHWYLVYYDVYSIFKILYKKWVKIKW